MTEGKSERVAGGIRAGAWDSTGNVELFDPGDLYRLVFCEEAALFAARAELGGFEFADGLTVVAIAVGRDKFHAASVWKVGR